MVKISSFSFFIFQKTRIDCIVFAFVFDRIGRGLFDKCEQIIMDGRNSNEWKNMKYKVIDTLQLKDNIFEERYSYLKNNLIQNDHLELIELIKCKGENHLQDTFIEMIENGGEGIMLRKPLSFYEPCRSSTLQRIKVFFNFIFNIYIHLYPIFYLMNLSISLNYFS